jgi:hypothetical protein
MAVCRLTNNIDFDCSEFVSGGLKTRVFLGTLSELASYTVDVNGYIDSFTFTPTAGKGLYEVNSSKASHSASTDIARNEGGNPSHTHTVTLRVFEGSPEVTERITEMSKTDLFAVVETTDGDFRVFGLGLGLNISSAPQDSGTVPSADARRTIVLSSEEPNAPAWFFDVDYATTKALLESYVF